MKLRINWWLFGGFFITLIGIMTMFFYSKSITKWNLPKTQNLVKIEEQKVNIAIVFTGSGLGDKSYNDLAYDGVLQAQKKLGIQFDYREPRKVQEYEKTIRELASEEIYQLIIAIGPEQEDAIQKVSKDYPNQKFTIIDSKLQQSNVSAIYTKWEEQTFLDGIIAGLLMKEHNAKKPYKAGVILGMDVPHLRQGAVGFEAGVKYIEKNSQVLVTEVGSFSDPLRAKEISLLMYDQGVEYIQHLAGASGLGVFSAAKEVDKFAFGVDANQNFFQPDNIVATTERQVDKIVFYEIKKIKEKTWSPGIHEYGMKEGIIKITREGSNIVLSPQIKQAVEQIKKQMMNDEITVPSRELELQSWISQHHYTGTH